MNRKILIIGGPRCGKTTYAKKLKEDTGLPLKHFDDLIGKHSWEDMSGVIAKMLDEPGPWIMEGVGGVRGLRQWLRDHHHAPGFEIHVLDKPKIAHTKGQANMHKTHLRMLDDIKRQLGVRKKTMKYV